MSQRSLKKVKVKSVKSLGKTKQKVFDVTMKSNPHTFFANDILVHNSCYFRVLAAENIQQAEEYGAEVVKACDEGSIPMLVTEIFNGDDVMRSDFEAITRSTLSYGRKKQYAFLKAWEDGEVLPKPKLSITGLSIKRSDSPKQLSNEMKPFFEKIMAGISHDEIKDIMDTIEKDYEKLSLYDLAAKRTANGLNKYKIAFDYEIINKDRPYNIEKLDEAVEEEFGPKIKIPEEIYVKFMAKGEGSYNVESNELVEDPNGPLKMKVKNKMVIPFHIKASILYNYLLDEHGVKGAFNEILNGDKIKIFYTQPFKMKIKVEKDGEVYDMIQEFDCLAFPATSRKLAPFLYDYKPDRKRMLQTYFYGKMETIFDVIGYDPEAVENKAIDALF